MGREELVRRLSYLQHERLLHLLVTLTVGLAALVTCITTLLLPLLTLYLLDGVLLVLFAAYLVHYRKLENTAQEWYGRLSEMGRNTTQ